jgi:hypothetical protein
VLAEGDTVDRYTVVRPLGEGGMAKVWLVRHTTLETLHALKVLQLTGPSLRLRFLDEAKTHSKLRHENIVRVSDVLEIDGLPALVLDYIDGPDLMHWIARELPDPARAEAMFRGILAGVAAAHAAGFVHRDLKPANVLVATGPDGAPLPKVADFGLAKALTPDGDSRGFATRQGHPMGTPRYMAPEQIRDASKADVRSDVFALGAILYELLAHEPAFDGLDVVEIFQAVSEGRRKPLPAKTPAHLARVVDACLTIDPAQRPQTVGEVLRLLDQGRHPAAAELAAKAAVPIALWLGAWAVVVGGGAALAGALLLVVFVRGGDPEGPCAVASGPLGAVRAPTVFSKKTGDSWLLRESTQVYAAVPEPGATPEPACRLPLGTRIRLDEDPVVVGRERWIVLAGDQLTPPVPNDPELGENRGPCEGEPGAFVGYVRTRGGGLLGGGSPREGGTWSVTAGREVFAFVPAEGDPDPPIACVVHENIRIRIVGEPEKVGREWWVPFTLPDPADPVR